MVSKSPRASLLGHIGFLDMYSFVRRTLTRSHVAIIMYHHVTSGNNPLLTSNVSTEDFEKEIAFLSKLPILPLEVLADKLMQGQKLPTRAVCISFDDGYSDNYKYAYPILRKYNVPATIFLTTGYIENSDTFWDDKVRFAIWNTNVERFTIDDLGFYRVRSASDRLQVMNRVIDHLRELSNTEKYPIVKKLLAELQVEIPSGFGDDISLTWREILEMSNNGVSFGAHTVTHPILTKVSLEDAKTEITLSKKAIEENVRIPCTLFAYPNGCFNNELIRLVRDIGFTCAVTTIPRLVTNDADRFMLSRLDAGPSLYAFKCNLSGLTQDYISILNFLGQK